ncbi:MAG: efflux transporter outer membrane subunit [Sedimentisphaerales bacterium]|nr:efflux transporter outer membrane subunit [Sedimentisphaerales bacterium]
MTNSTIKLFYIFLLSVTWGCAPEIKTVPSPVLLPETFSATGGQPLPDKWWLSFQDELLNTLMEQALTDNFDMLIAWDRLAQMEAIAVQSGAELLPEVNLSGSASRTREDTDSRTSYYSLYSIGVQVSYELDLWGRIRAAHQGDLLMVEASREDVNATAIILSARIAKTWYQLAEVRAQIKVIDKQIQTNKTVLELITTQFRNGVSGAADVLRQRQLVEARQGQRIPLQERKAVLQHELAVLLGTTPGLIAEPAENHLTDLPLLPTVPVPAELIQRRPDVRAAFLAVQAADQNVATAIADKFPRISLSAQTQTSATQVRDLFDNWLANIAANLVQPLFDGDRRQARVDYNRAVLSQTIHQYSRVLQNSIREVEDALIQEQQQAQYLQSLEKQLEIAREVMTRTRESYLKGQFDYLRVLDSLVSTQILELSCLSAKRELIDRRIELCQAIAGSWEMEKPEITSIEDLETSNQTTM